MSFGNIFACLLPAFAMFNKVLVSVPKCRCCHFQLTTDHQCHTVQCLALCPNADIAIFLTTVSVITQQSFALFLNGDVTMFLTSLSVSSQQFFFSVPMWRCSIQFLLITVYLYCPVNDDIHEHPAN